MSDPKSPTSMGATTTAPWATDRDPQTGLAGGMSTPPPMVAPWAPDADMGGAMGARPATPMPTGVPREPPAGPPPQLVDAAAGLPVVSDIAAGHRFNAPRKILSSQEDIQKFLQSEAIKEYIGFLMACNEAVKGKKLSEQSHISPSMEQLMKELDTLSELVDEIPPQTVELRFGNPAYRSWFERMVNDSQAAVSRCVPDNLQDAVGELAAYWADSFGNVVRIDYGTGHETTFAALLFCLAKAGVITQDCLQAVVTKVFVKYLNLMRKLQTTYWLEPAGSHGVWGLDDYQFLPFFWGAAQLIGHPYIKPKSIHNVEVLEGFSHEYLYLGCVTFVKEVKKGNLSETSPMLNDISGVPTWKKVNSGMMKMYQAEVLAKLPIMQHMLFGSLLSFP